MLLKAADRVQHFQDHGPPSRKKTYLQGYLPRCKKTLMLGSFSNFIHKLQIQMLWYFLLSRKKLSHPQ